MRKHDGQGENMRRSIPAAALLMAACLLSATSVMFAADAAKPDEAPGLGDPGQLKSIAIKTGRLEDGAVLISGRDAVQQLVVEGSYASGQIRDLSRDVTYSVTPTGIIEVDASGYVSPLKEGTATVQARTTTGQDVTISVNVTNIANDLSLIHI